MDCPLPAWFATAILCLFPLTARAEILEENFIGDPAGRGWHAHGETSLFRWNPEREVLEVTWDSAYPNSYFHRALGREITEADDFAITFEMTLQTVAAGVSPERPYTFQLAAGLFNAADAMRSGFFRGTGTDSVNLVEFNYFPDTGLGATVSPVIVSKTGLFVPSFTFPYPLLPGNHYAITLVYTAATRTLRTSIRENGQAMPAIRDVKLGPAFPGFTVDTFSISSYHDARSGGSLLAHGWVHQVTLELPDLAGPAVRIEREHEAWQIHFTAKPGWRYVVEKSDSLLQWISVSEPLTADGELVFTDNSPEGANAFYRVRAERP
jgi:hypothetical protein